MPPVGRVELVGPDGMVYTIVSANRAMIQQWLYETIEMFARAEPAATNYVFRYVSGLDLLPVS